jgi:AAA ATPase-like protein
VSVLANPLVARAEELGLVEHALDDLGRYRSAAVALGGEPGIGKTRLLHELAARAEVRGQLVLSGTASELGRDLPFSVFVDAVDEYLQSLVPRWFAHLDADVQAELAHVFPSLSTLGGGGRVGLQHERYRHTERWARCLSGSRKVSRWCWCSMTCIGRTRRRWSYSADCCGARVSPAPELLDDRPPC